MGRRAEWSLDNFNVDIDNCMLLTNEHIHYHQLSTADYTFKVNHARLQAADEEARQAKRQLQQKEYKDRRKKRRESGNSAGAVDVASDEEF